MSAVFPSGVRCPCSVIYFPTADASFTIAASINLVLPPMTVASASSTLITVARGEIDRKPRPDLGLTAEEFSGGANGASISSSSFFMFKIVLLDRFFLVLDRPLSPKDDLAPDPRDRPRDTTSSGASCCTVEQIPPFIKFSTADLRGGDFAARGLAGMVI